MKSSAAGGVRTLRPGPPSRDPSYRNCNRPISLNLSCASPIATSSRVRLPPSPTFTPPLSFFARRYASSPTSRHAPPSPLSPETVSVPNYFWDRPSSDQARGLKTSASSQASVSDLDHHATFTEEEFKRIRASERAGGSREADAAGLDDLFRPPKSPRASSDSLVDDYVPTDADLCYSEPAGYIPEDIWADLEHQSDGDEEAPPLDAYEDPAPKIKRKKLQKYRQAVLDLPLVVGQGLEVGDERYDWRKTALSQLPEERKGKVRWFPDEARITRERGQIAAKLEEGDRYYEEVTQYKAHFLPLLEAERKEELEAHAKRQLEWDHARLTTEGWILEELGATPFRVPKNPGSIVYTFAKVGVSGHKADLPYHKFKIGEVTEICRTHPHYDFVLADGKVKDSTEKEIDDWQRDINASPLIESKDDKLFGSVYSVGRKYIRIAFDEPVEGIELGRWRLDVGLNDIAYKRQVEAIRYQNADLAQIQRFDANNARLAGVSPYRVSPARSVEDEVFNRPIRPQRIRQTVFQGTDVRDILLRAFQEPYIPYDASETLQLDKPSSKEQAPVVIPNDIHPGDVDATAVPPPHPSSEPSSILWKNELLASWTRRYRVEGEPVRVEGDPIVPLNPTQLRAIAMMLSERLSLVQGPPGTGKTRVIIETIKLLKQHWKIPHPILVTAHTNAAVDNLLGGLRAHGVKAARWGRDEVIRSDLQQWSVEQLSEVHPLWAKKEKLDERIIEIDRQIKQGEMQAQGLKPGEKPEKIPPKSQLIAEKTGLRQEVRLLKMDIRRDVLLDADVICTTCLSAASWSLDAIDFPIVFLDEASMATEPLSLVPIMKGSSHVAIIGDHKQLPPVIISEIAQANGLATSMFERLIHEGKLPSIMLDTQYRMHPQIAFFPNQAFYASALSNGTAFPDGSVRPGLEPPLTDFLAENEDGVRQNVTFLHHDSDEDMITKSIRNVGESKRVCDVVANLLFNNPDLTGADIGVITPYSAQIRQLTRDMHEDEAQRVKFVVALGKERAEELEKIEIKTVDGFEGREKAVIIFSTVRNNPGGFIGFMADWRRLNVGLTRAKRALIMLGSAEHLSRSKIGKKAAATLPAGGARKWRELMAWLHAEGLVLDLEVEGEEVIAESAEVEAGATPIQKTATVSARRSAKVASEQPRPFTAVEEWIGDVPSGREVGQYEVDDMWEEQVKEPLRSWG